MRKVFFVTLSVMVTFFSCNSNTESKSAAVDSTGSETVSKTDTTITTAHNSLTSLDWEGTYKGVVPCADCEGIETKLTIGKDLTYTITTKYLGKPNPDVYKESGTFQWDVAGNIIRLNKRENAPDKYKVGENILIQLDMEGNLIKGENASKYYLKKQ
jgi:uncharacterized lipoprotein NlpE involved in copper resistance